MPNLLTIAKIRDGVNELSPQPMNFFPNSTQSKSPYVTDCSFQVPLSSVKVAVLVVLSLVPGLWAIS